MHRGLVYIILPGENREKTSKVMMFNMLFKKVMHEKNKFQAEN